MMGHGIIAWIIIGLIAGWLTGKIMKGSGFGFLMDMLVGNRWRPDRRIPLQSPGPRGDWRARPDHEHRDRRHRSRDSYLDRPAVQWQSKGEPLTGA